MAVGKVRVDTDLERRYEELYQRYAKPLEATAMGQYVAAVQDGRTLVADTLLEAVQQAKSVLGPGNFVFKIGEPAVGKLR